MRPERVERKKELQPAAGNGLRTGKVTASAEI
jgi:hypothetical protein